jgi:hypothetical protein
VCIEIDRQRGWDRERERICWCCLLLMCRVSCLDSLTHDTSAHTQIVLRRFTELLLLSGGSANHHKREERKTMGEIFWWVYRRTLVVGCVCVCVIVNLYMIIILSLGSFYFLFLLFSPGVIGDLIDTANEWWRGRREHGGIDEILRKLIFFCVLGFFLILLVSKFYQITFFCCCRL